MFTSYDKAIAAFLTALISILALTGLPVPDFVKEPAFLATATSVIVGLVTVLTRNKGTDNGSFPPKT